MRGNFTRGPWRTGHLGTDSTCQCSYVLSDGYHGAVCTIHVDNGIKSIAAGGNDAPPLKEAAANMHLIGAAPDMYGALEDAETDLILLRMAIDECDPARELLARVDGLSRLISSALKKTETPE